MVLALGAAGADAQTVAGLVRDRATGATVADVPVALRGATDSVLARARTDSLGAFYLPAPGAGTYRVAFAFGAQHVVESDTVALSDTTVLHQRAYVLDVPTDIAWFEFQVDVPVAPLNNAAPDYTPRLQSLASEGGVIAEFVVDTLGRAEMDTFTARDATHPEFTAAVRAALPRMRFAPAERHGRKVRQLVHQAFLFRGG